MMALYIFPVPLLLQFVMFLISNAFVIVKCTIGNTLVSNAKDADCVLVKASRNSGKDRAVPLHKSISDGMISIFDVNYILPAYWFEFQNIWII